MKKRTVLLATLALVAFRPAPSAPAAAKATAVFAGGCYWTTEAVFEHLKGVKSVESGFADPAYPDDGTKRKGFAEAVRVVYDPDKVTYEQLLEVFFTAAHDPTQLDRQGPDVGPRYRSMVFVADEAERRLVEAYIARLDSAKTYRRPIVTEVVGLKKFRTVPEDQQDFVAKNPRHPYVVTHDRPKLARLREKFPALYED